VRSDINSYIEEQRERLEEKLIRELGQELIAALSDNQIVEIMLNSDGKLWYDYLGKGMVEAGCISKCQAENLLGTVAAISGTLINTSAPILETELPFSGSRFTGITRPISSAPIFTIRKRPEVVFTLNNYLQHEIISENHVNAIKKAVENRQNILVVGGTGSGKSTLVNAILHHISVISPADRVIIVEDTLELKCTVANTVELRTSTNVNIAECIRTSLRMRPDRIIIGEIRGAEANSLIKAWNTGHPGGVSTIHANSASLGLTRIEQLIEEAGITPNSSIIAETINLVIYIERIKQHPSRLVKEVVWVRDYKEGQYLLDTVR
jgi:type IV secretion system protein VirB11